MLCHLVPNFRALKEQTYHSTKELKIICILTHMEIAQAEEDFE